MLSKKLYNAVNGNKNVESNVIVKKETTYFDINGKSASRQQFSLQNVFTLTVHKVQGFTLFHVTITIDKTVFVEGQVYVTMSLGIRRNEPCYLMEKPHLKLQPQVYKTPESRSRRIQKIRPYKQTRTTKYLV